MGAFPINSACGLVVILEVEISVDAAFSNKITKFDVDFQNLLRQFFRIWMDNEGKVQ